MKPQWTPQPQVIKSPEQRYNEMLSGATDNQIVEVSPSICHEIDDQPFSVNEDVVNELAESIIKYGQTDPIHIIPSTRYKNEYDILSGRHRNRACKKAGINVKAIIEKTDDKSLSRARLLITNLHRNNNYKPSELAYAYKELAEIQKTSGNKATVSQVAKQNNVSDRQIRRYIKLCDLIPQLLDKVDDEQISFLVGVELSYFDESGQQEILKMMDCDNQFKLSLDLVKNMRSYVSNPTQKDVYDFFHATEVSAVKIENASDKNTESIKHEEKNISKDKDASVKAKQAKSLHKPEPNTTLKLNNEEECKAFLQKYSKWTLITSLESLNLAFYEYCFKGYRLIAMQYLRKDKETAEYKKSVKIYLLSDNEIFNIYAQSKLEDIIQRLLEIIKKDREDG